MPKAAIFDLDGTLLDSVDLHALAWREAMVDAGCKWKRSMIWLKPDGAPQFTGDRPGMGWEAVAILHREGKKRWNGGATRPPNPLMNDPCTLKPIALRRFCTGINRL